MTVLPTPLTAWHLRIHIGKHSPAGASTKVKFFGCEDLTATKPCKNTGHRVYLIKAMIRPVQTLPALLDEQCRVVRFQEYHIVSGFGYFRLK